LQRNCYHSCYRWEKLILNNLLRAAGPKTGRISIWEEDSRFQTYILLTKFLHFVCAQLCQTLRDPLDYGPPASSIHRIFPARVLECVAISSSRESSWPRDRTASPVSPVLAGRFFTTEPHTKWRNLVNKIYVWDLESSSQMLILPVFGPAALSKLFNINFSHL